MLPTLVPYRIRRLFIHPIFRDPLGRPGRLFGGFHTSFIYLSAFPGSAFPVSSVLMCVSGWVISSVYLGSCVISQIWWFLRDFISLCCAFHHESIFGNRRDRGGVVRSCLSLASNAELGVAHIPSIGSAVPVGFDHVLSSSVYRVVWRAITSMLGST